MSDGTPKPGRSRKPPKKTKSKTQEQLRLVPNSEPDPAVQDMQRLICDLETHKVELQMQNEELRSAQSALEESQAKYSDLYDFAPAGYFSFDAKGRILEANLTGADLLGLNRATLQDTPFLRFIAPESRNAFHRHLRDVLADGGQQTCDLELVRQDGTRFYVRMETMSTRYGKSESTHCRSAVIDVTDRRRAREALADSEARYRQLVDAAPDPVVVVTADTVVYANAAAARLAGLDIPGRLVGSPLAGFVPRQHRDRLSAIVQRTIDEGGNFPPSEVESIRPDGNSVTVEVVGTGCIYDGKPSVQVIARDTSERRRARKALEFSQRVLHIANRHTEIAPLLGEIVAQVREYSNCQAVGVRILDAEGNIPYLAYDGFSRSFYESESPLSIHSDDCMCINVVKGTTDPRQSFYTEGGSFFMNDTSRFLATVSEEDKGKTRNVCNQVGYESVALVPIKVEERMLGLIHVADSRENRVPLETVEVLEGVALQLGTAVQRVIADENLRASEERYRALVEASPDAITMSDVDGRILMCNAQAAALRGFDCPEAMIGLSLFDFVAPEDRERARDDAKATMKGKAVRHTSYTLLKKDGSRFPGTLDASPIADARGRRSAVMSLARDITERKRVREQQRKAVETLERSHDRAEELAAILGSERDTLQVIMDNTDAQLAYLDAGFHFVMVNPAYERVCGYPKEELLGRNYFDLFPDPKGQAIFERVRGTGEAVEYEAKPFRFETQPQRGTTYWDWTLTPVKDRRQEVTGLVLSVVDVTEAMRSSRYAVALNEIETAMLSTLDAEELVGQIVVRSRAAMATESCKILLRDGSGWVVASVDGIGKSLLASHLSDEELPHVEPTAKTKDLVVIDDAYNDARVNRAYARKHRLRSTLCLPLVARDRTVALMCFSNHSKPIAFSPAQIDFASKLSTSVSLALENARLYSSLAEELLRVQLLQDVAERATADADLRTVAEGILRALSAQLPLSAGDIRVLDRELQELQLVASFGFPPSTVVRLSREKLQDGESLASRAVLERRVLTHEDLPATENKAAKREQQFPRDHRFVVAPITHRDQIVGTCSLVFPESRPFSDEEMDLFHSVGRVTGQAIENARLHEAETEARLRATRDLDVANLLRDAANRLSRSLNTTQVLNSLADIVTAVTARNRVLISLIDRRTNEVTIAASRPESAPSVGTKRKLGAMPRECADAFTSTDVTVLDFDDPDISAAAKRYAERNQMRRCLVVPLVLGDRLIGQIEIDEAGKSADFGLHEIRLVEGIASQAAVVLENARLHEGSVAKARSLEVVSQAARLITSTLRMDAALAQILDYSSILFQAQGSLVLLADDDDTAFRVAARRGVSWKVGRKTLMRTEADRLGLSGRTPILVGNLRLRSHPSLFGALAREGYKSAITAPLEMEGRVRGLLIVLSTGSMSPSREEMAAFRLFSDQAATAVKNASAYEREHRIARILQESLAGPIPDIPGLDIGIAYESAYEAERVGGDFYDIFELDDGLVAVLIGDVSGKGVKAAGLTETIRSSARTLAYIDPSPGFVFARLNQSLLRQLSEGTFATAQLLVINVRTRELRAADAGHPPPILYGTHCRYMNMATAAPLGVETETYRESYEQFDVGDTILLYTDGIIEARRRGEFFGERRLLRALSYRRNKSPQETVDSLLAATKRFADGRLVDDVALLAIRLN